MNRHTYGLQLCSIIGYFVPLPLEKRDYSLILHFPNGNYTDALTIITIRIKKKKKKKKKNGGRRENIKILNKFGKFIRLNSS